MKLAIDEGYQYVACGHIHVPVIRKYSNNKGSVTYLNSGDWIENLTSLEYNNGTWSIYEYNKDTRINSLTEEDLDKNINNQEDKEIESQIEKELTEILENLS